MLAAMMLGAIFGGCFPVPVKIGSAPASFDAARLDGTWYVVASNFPMWVSGDKQNPTFRYTLLEDDLEPRKLDDVVWFSKGSGSGTFLGVDEQDSGDPTHFTWRGKGSLFLFSSEWYVARVAPDDTWAIVYYTATIASPDGVDIIARSPTLSADRMAQAHATIEQDPLLRAKARGLVPVIRTQLH